jgi:Major Facilitator Superfamily
LQTFLAQNLILMGAFFSIPLYLQLVVGLNALETGVRMLPVSIAMFITSLSGSGLATRFSPRAMVRSGFVVLVVALAVLIAAIEPELVSRRFALAMTLLGVGLGLIASQLGNVVQSAVGPADRSEAGGLQWTAQQIGSSLGVALIGAIVLTGLSATFVNQVAADERISAEVAQEVSVRVSGGIDFVATDAVVEAAQGAGLDDATTAHSSIRTAPRSCSRSRRDCSPRSPWRPAHCSSRATSRRPDHIRTRTRTGNSTKRSAMRCQDPPRPEHRCDGLPE